jgi:uncharacterized Zn finger protein
MIEETDVVAESMTEYPKTLELGVLEWHGKDGKLHPRVNGENLKAALTEYEWQRFCQWMKGSIVDDLGIRAWDVENFLNGRPENTIIDA